MTTKGIESQNHTDEPDCESQTAAVLDGGETQPADPGRSRDEVEDSADNGDSADEPEAVGGLGPKGGGWGGAQNPVNRAQAVGVRNGLRVTSRKRSSGSTGSDHHTSQRKSDAVDLSNGSSPTPQMDRTATQIAALLGVPGWRGGVLNRSVNGYRVQVLYRTNVGGNHYNHVHVGVRVH